MSADELCYASIRELGGLFRRARALAGGLRHRPPRRIETLDKSLNAYVTVTAERALADARAAEAALERGDAGPLAGIPIAYKDLYATRGILTTAGSALLADWVPDHDCDVRDAAAAGGHGHAGQAHHPRVRLRHPVPGPPLPAGAQPVEPRSHPRRLVERLGRGAGRRPGRGRARLGHRRIDPGPGGLLRHRRAQADLRAREPGRRADALVDARSHRPHGAHRGGLRLHAPGAGRPRPGRSRVEPRARAPTTWRRSGAACAGLRIGVPRDYFFDGVEPEVGGAPSRRRMATLRAARRRRCAT